MVLMIQGGLSLAFCTGHALPLRRLGAEGLTSYLLGATLSFLHKHYGDEKTALTLWVV